MKVVITGASGFIGSRLLQSARATYGSGVTAFTSGPVEGSHIIYQTGRGFGLDSTDLALVEATEVLIHAGAFTPKSRVESDQVVGCNSNVTFTQQLLELPWRNLRKVIFLSSADVYENVAGPVSESSLTVPASLYGLSKLYCERIVTIYAEHQQIASQILRLGNVYGPGEEAYAKVLPQAIRNILAGNKVEMWGDGTELRTFVYIDDVTAAVLNSVELRQEPGVINLAGGTAISVRDLLETLVAIGGRRTSIEQREYSGMTRDLLFDNAKLRRYLLDRETDFRTGLAAEFRHVARLMGVNHEPNI